MTLVSFSMLLVFLGAIGQTARILSYKRRTGKAIADLGMTPKNGFFLGIALLSFVYIAKIAKGGDVSVEAMQTWNLYLYYLCLGAIALLGIVGGVDRLKVRENGLTNASLMVTWDQINDYHWNGQNLVLDHKNLIFSAWKTRLRLKQEAFDILEPHLAKIGNKRSG